MGHSGLGSGLVLLPWHNSDFTAGHIDQQAISPPPCFSSLCSLPTKFSTVILSSRVMGHAKCSPPVHGQLFFMPSSPLVLTANHFQSLQWGDGDRTKKQFCPPLAEQVQQRQTIFRGFWLPTSQSNRISSGCLGRSRHQAPGIWTPAATIF